MLKKALHILFLFLSLNCLATAKLTSYVETHYYMMLKDTNTLAYKGVVNKVWSTDGVQFAELRTLLNLSKGIDFTVDTIHLNELFYTCGDGVVLNEDGQTVVNNHAHRIETNFRFNPNDTLLVFTSKEKSNMWSNELLSYKLESTNEDIIGGLQAFFKENENSFNRKEPVTLNFPYERIYLGPYHVNWRVYFLTDYSKGTQQRIGLSFETNTKKVIREIAYNHKGETEYLYEYVKKSRWKGESFLTKYDLIDSVEVPISTMHCMVDLEQNSTDCISSVYEYYSGKQLKSLEHFGDKNTLRCKISFHPNGTIENYYVNNNQHLKFSVSPDGKIIYQGENRVYDEKNIK